MALLRAKVGEEFVLDPLTTVLITVQVLINGYMTVRYIQIDMYIATTSIVFLLLTVAGLALHQTFCGGVKFASHISAGQFGNLLQGLLVGIVGVAVAQTVAFQLTPATALAWITVLERKAFYFSGAISEETFFRYFLQTKLHQSMPRLALSVPIIAFAVSLVFTTWHFGVYANSVGSLMAVFCASVVLCVIYAWTRRLSVVQLIHAWVNFFAS